MAPLSATRHLIPLVERAWQAFRQGQTATAEQLWLEVLELSPGQLGALEILYRLRRTQNWPRVVARHAARRGLGRGRNRPQRDAGERPPAGQDRPLRRGVRCLHPRQEAGARGWRHDLSRRPAAGAGATADGVLHHQAHGLHPARHGGRRLAAAGVHPRLPALRHHAGEQTLSAHPRIRAGDELPTINDITQIMPRVLASPTAYPEALAELWMGDQQHGIDTLRDVYFQRARQIGAVDPAGLDGAPWFTDKIPLNEMHLGLIGLTLPQAPLIHVRHHPLDVVVSVFSNHLTPGFRCALDLEALPRTTCW